MRISDWSSDVCSSDLSANAAADGCARGHRPGRASDSRGPGSNTCASQEASRQMAEIVWSEPALSDLEAIADYIALENPVAASELVSRVFDHVEQLIDHPESGSRPPELKRSRYRQIVEAQ